ncbi:hypothetical protein [Anaerocolumna xylanovorans]|uniref:Lipoprotein n=1 Tax=Anaerocolumna xylanovorans DSM 12503 TaxID=1121345 RepID=A0A1M7Y5K1_9FIRM|nr:hypothetical protein [Anaerocolumna xylanovorans]SHO47788.1 hypothetical protein SAMN02745217_01657 [Anaerocolumna xylanovorans DSM 12503]
MRKIFFSTALLLCLVMLVGCSKNKEIDTKNIQKNTFLIKKDGSIEAGTVESFDKAYYNLEELEKYVTDKIGKYNASKGAETIAKKNLELKDANAVLVITYETIDDYNGFNQTDDKLLTTAEAKNGNIELPESFTAVKKHKTVTLNKALENKKYKVLILKEKLDVLLQGTIKYYSGGTLVDKHNIETAESGSTIIVYKP